MLIKICIIPILLHILHPCCGSSCQQVSYPVLFQRGTCFVGDEISSATVSKDAHGQSPSNNSSPLSSDSVVTEQPPPQTSAPADLATFDEWKQKILSAENASDQVTSVDKPPVAVKPSTSKSDSNKNFASVDCGARIISSNPEATNAHAILTDSKDEYMNNPCSASRKFVVVELCDSVSVSEIVLGNLELFSSLPKLYNISISDRYPAKDTGLHFKFMAKEERQLSSIKIAEIMASNGIVKPPMFAKFIKVEMLEHYGSEHYCPLTAVRVIGKGLLDDDDDDDESLSSGSSVTLEDAEAGKPPTNTLFGVAKKTVIQLFEQVLPPRVAQNDSAKLENASSVNSLSNKTFTVPTSNARPRFDRVSGIFEACSRCSNGGARNQCSASNLCTYYHLAETERTRQKDDPWVPAEEVTQPQAKNGCGAAPVLSQTTTTPPPVLEDTLPTDQQHQKNEEAPSQCDDIASIDPANVSANAATIPSIPSSETATKPLEQGSSSSDSSPSSSITPEQIIVAGLFAPVSGLAGGADDEPAIDANGELFPKSSTGKPVLQSLSSNGDAAERYPPSLSASASSKQLLIRFVTRVRELEANLSLTNRYLEELSSNYRKRLDELKVKVDFLSNITTTQASEIERLTQLLNSTNKFYETVLLSSNQSDIAIPFSFMALVIAVFCFFILAFTCIIRRKVPSKSSTNRFSQTAPLGVVYSNGTGSANFITASNIRCYELPPFVLDGSPLEVNGNLVASAPASPLNGSVAGGSPARQLSDSAEFPENALSSKSNGDIYSWPRNAGSLNSTPLVVPSTLSTSFLLSPLEKNKKHRKHRQQHQLVNGHNNSTNGLTAKPISPHRNSAEK